MDRSSDGVTTQTGPVPRDEELLSLEEAAQLLGTSATTLYRLLKQGGLPALKVGRQWRFRRDDLLSHLVRSPGGPVSVPTEEVDAEIAFFGADPQQADQPGDGEDAETRMKR